MAETLQGRSDVRLRQISFFLPNRLGTLHRALAHLEEENVRICGIAVQEAADHAVVRAVVDRPEAAVAVLRSEGYGYTETEILGVSLPLERGASLRRILTALLAAEVSVEYLFGLLVRVGGRVVAAVQVDDQTLAARVLTGHGLPLVGQDEIAWDDAR